jgi:hypothetical protein
MEHTCTVRHPPRVKLHKLWIKRIKKYGNLRTSGPQRRFKDSHVYRCVTTLQVAQSRLETGIAFRECSNMTATHPNYHSSFRLNAVRECCITVLSLFSKISARQFYRDFQSLGNFVQASISKPNSSLLQDSSLLFRSRAMLFSLRGWFAKGVGC